MLRRIAVSPTHNRKRSAAFDATGTLVAVPTNDGEVHIYTTHGSSDPRVIKISGKPILSADTDGANITVVAHSAHDGISTIESFEGTSTQQLGKLAFQPDATDGSLHEPVVSANRQERYVRQGVNKVVVYDRVRKLRRRTITTDIENAELTYTPQRRSVLFMSPEDNGFATMGYGNRHTKR